VPCVGEVGLIESLADRNVCSTVKCVATRILIRAFLILPTDSLILHSPNV
jgi:hypothetical protein